LGSNNFRFDNKNYQDEVAISFTEKSYELKGKALRIIKKFRIMSYELGQL
jgi:hypothetical protein